MKNYYHVLYLGRSKGLSILNKRWVQTDSFTRAHQYSRIHPKSPQTPHPFSNSHFSRNRCRIVSNVSHNYPPPSLSNLNLNNHHAQISTMHTLQVSDHEVDNQLDYQVKVKESEFISATHAPNHEFWMPLSNLDLLLPPLAAEGFFCYQKKDETAMSMEMVVKTLKESLAGVLSIYYPLAGEIVPNRHGEPEVLCNNNGVEFVQAHADVDLKSLDLHHPDESVKGKLVPKLNRGVFSVQVTELNCGSIIVSCAFDHRLTDAKSCTIFLTAWAEFARFNKISNIPSFRSSILSPRRPPRYDTTFEDMYIPVSSLPPPPPSYVEDPLCSRFYYIDAESIQQVQSQASTKDIRRSKLQSFTAYIWKLLAQKRDCDANETTRVGVIVNGQKFLTGNTDEELSYLKTHYGNILSIPYGKENNHHLNEMTLDEVANKVNAFVNTASNEEHFRGLVDWVELHRPEPGVARIYFKLDETDGDAVVVSAGYGLQTEIMQFGWGEPEFGSYHFPWGGQTGYITTAPSAKNNGDWVVYTHLKQKHLDLIDSKASHVFKPLSQSYLNFR
ncbi:hypothetical protein LXL04_028462 [Taraxacum kok-saghyz]